MTRYRITNTATGVDLGTYEATSPEGALDAMAREAGYADYSQVEALVPVGIDPLSVDEVADEATVTTWVTEPRGRRLYALHGVQFPTASEAIAAAKAAVGKLIAAWSGSVMIDHPTERRGFITITLREGSVIVLELCRCPLTRAGLRRSAWNPVKHSPQCFLHDEPHGRRVYRAEVQS